MIGSIATYVLFSFFFLVTQTKTNIPKNSAVDSNVVCCSMEHFANGHTSSNTPDPIRTRKLSGERPGQYWGGGPPGKPLGCCWLFDFLSFYFSSRFAPVAVVRRCHSCLGAILLSNLPGWRWATIKQVALDRLSRSLHSDVCDSDGCSDAVVHSRISGCGNRRVCAVPN